MLTGIVVMLAVGMIIQHSSLFNGLVGGEAEETRVVLTTDSVDTKPGGLSRIEVFANDVNVTDLHANRIAIAEPPACGQVFVQDYVLQYFAEPDCTERQEFSYRIIGSPEIEPGLVQIRIIGAPAAIETVDAPSADVDPSDEEPVIARSSGSESAPAPLQSEDLAVAAPDPADDLPSGTVPSSIAPEPAPASKPEALDLDVATVSPAPQQAPETPLSPRIKEESLSVSATQLADLPRAETSPLQAPQAETVPEGLDGIAIAATEDRESRQRRLPRSSAQPIDRTAESNATLDLPAQSAVESESALLRPLTGGLDITPEPSLSVARVELAEPSGDLPSGPRFVLNPQSALPTFTGSEVSRAAPERSQIAALSLEIEPSPGEAPQQAQSLLPPLSPRAVNEPGTPAPALDGQVARVGPASAVDRSSEPGTQPGTQIDAATLRASGTVAPKSTPRDPEAELAALTPGAVSCLAHPALSFDIKSYGQTGLGVTAPCEAGEVVELTYSGINLALPLDQEGEGYLLLQGFEQSSAARLRFANGQVIDFDLPFSGINNVARVALVWDAPIDLNLHALEFGAQGFSAGDVNMGNSRSFSEVRRSGGGYLSSHAPIAGIGQSVEIYTHVLRRRGQSGVVDLYVDFASRNRARMSETCDGGPHARPIFKLMRTERGVMERAEKHRFAGLACAEIPGGSALRADAGFGSLIVSP